MFGDIPVWARLLMTLITLAAGVFVFLFISTGFGIGLFVVGIAMLIFCERSKGEKSGYKF